MTNKKKLAELAEALLNVLDAEQKIMLMEIIGIVGERMGKLEPSVDETIANPVIANHTAQLMRINAQMFESTIRALGQVRSDQIDREFQIAMAAEKNARANRGFQKLLQIGMVVAAKNGGEKKAAKKKARAFAKKKGAKGAKKVARRALAKKKGAKKAARVRRSGP